MFKTDYQRFIHASRYARWNENEGRRETWDETVQRYFDFFIPYLRENHGSIAPQEYLPIKDAVQKLDVMPSMRCLMAAGNALGRDHVSGYNPVAGSTLVLTHEHGLVPIEQLSGSTATVLNKDSRWTAAEFNCYGSQDTHTVSLKLNSNTLNSVDCTANHRWLLEGGRVVPTEFLRSGDRVPFVAAERPSTDDEDYRLGVIHGLVYGDGTAVYSCKRAKGYHIRLCSDAADLLPWFDGYPVCYPPSANGDPVVMLYDGFAKTHSLKTLPSVDETDSYLVGFLRGWMAADGYISAAGQVSICTKEAGKWWLEHIASKVGFVVQRATQQSNRTNLGERKSHSWVVFLSRSSLLADDFLIERKRERFRPLESHYVVVSVEPTGRVEPVYCAEVPDTNTFVLNKGLVTGNCAYRPVDDIRAFDEILFVLMCATGVGFSVERQYVNQLPALPERLEESGITIAVRDSKRGWAEAYRELLSLLYAGRIPKWDTSKVRPAGARLKTMGGRASGPQPLIDLFTHTIRLFQNAIENGQRKLTSIQCHDIICMIGECVVVGGVRRSALISLSNLSDQRMRDAKSGEWWVLEPQRRIANNSVAYTEQPEVGQYMEEWMSLYASKSGERGIFNREAARIQAMKNERRKGNLSNGIEPRAIDFGTNPCVSGDTPILTSHGYYEISDLVDQPVQIWNGEQWSSVVPFSTGMNETVIVTFSDGTSLHCTPYHMFLVWDGWSRGGNERRVCAEDLRPGDKLTKYDMPFVNEGSDPNIDGYSQGFYAGDGNHGLNHSWLYEPKYSCAARLVGDIKKDGDRLRKRWTHGPMLDRRFVPVKATSAYCLEWLAGLLDSDGTVTKDKQGSGFQITSIDKTFLLHTQLMLTRLGIRAKVVRGHESREKDMPGGTYYCQKTWRLLIGNTDSAYLISKGLQLSRLEHDGQIPQRDARQFVRVISVYDAGPHETFCFTDSLANRGTFNGIVTGNCGEIILRPKQFCNLSTVVVRPDDNPDTLEEKVRLATILGTWQSTLTKFRYLTKKWQDNCEEERLLGVSMTGIMANPLLNGRSASGLGGTANLLLRLKEVAISTNKEWAERLGIPQSAAVTCIKPEGTSSQLVNTPSGMHTAFSKYYIRTVRQDAKDPLTQMMIDQGVPYEIDVMNKENVVFSFPAESPEGSVLRNDMSALEQLEHWKVFHDNWCEHNPSITVYVREKEWPSVGAWVWDNFDSAGGLAFLPHTDHTYKQAPYQEITKEKYQEVLAAMPEIDWSGLSKYESEDNTNNTRELACSAGICDII